MKASGLFVVEWSHLVTALIWNIILIVGVIGTVFVWKTNIERDVKERPTEKEVRQIIDDESRGDRALMQEIRLDIKSLISAQKNKK